MKKKRVLPEGWHEVTIGDKFKTGSGGTPLSTNRDYYEGGSIPWINSGELNENYIDRTDNYITELGLNNSSAKIFPKGTVLLAMYGATAGKTSLLKIDACTNQAICAILENHEYSNLFLKYNLENLYEYLVNFSSGSARDNLSQEGIAELTLYFPDGKAFQEKLIKVLEKIDQKIILNTRMNAELEAMAKQLYDYWFVQFDFPDENGKPYKSSGGKMVYNPTLKREIPAGWEVLPISGILDKVISTPRLQTEEYYNEGSFPIIDQTTDVYYAGFTDKEEALSLQYPAVIFGDHSCAVKYVNFPFVRGADGTQVMLSKNKNISTEYLYFYVKGIKVNKGYARHYSFIKDSLIIVPSYSVAKNYKNYAERLFYQITQRRLENNYLTHLRDSLLPMLMNGQVTVE